MSDNVAYNERVASISAQCSREQKLNYRETVKMINDSAQRGKYECGILS